MSDKDFLLFYNDYSICSIMVRFTLAVAGQTNRQLLNITEKPINIHGKDQLSEYYLTEVNPSGTVPVLKSVSGSDPTLTESLDITHFLGRFYTHLCPANLMSKINPLLDQLHQITYFSLTYSQAPQRATDMLNAVEAKLADTSISEQYRKALEFKLEVVRTTRTPALTPEFIAAEEKKATDFLAEIDKILGLPASREGDTHTTGSSPWLFRTGAGTALDAHVAAFVCRLFDVGRRNLVPYRVQEYAEKVFQLPLWTGFMGGRSTVHKAYA